MRIFYAADHEPFPGNQLWHNNLYLSLVDLGHEVIPFDYNLTPHFKNVDPALPAQRQFIQRYQHTLECALLEQIRVIHRRQPIDLFFSYFYSAMCRPEVIREIRSMGICTVNWYCNGSFQFHLVATIAPAYDYCLVPEKFRLPDYKSIGANPIYCQEAANPAIYMPFSLEREYDVTFVGQKYGDRPDHIRALLDTGIDVRVWGSGWQPTKARPVNVTSVFRPHLASLKTSEGRRELFHKAKRRITRRPFTEVEIPANVCGPPLSDAALVQLYSRSVICLGFSSCGNTHLDRQRILQVRLRDFEAPMSGAFYMVEYMAELEDFYDIRKEIVCYYDKSDLVEKCKYYLHHSTEREQIRQAGYLRAQNEHTWQKRLEQAFRAMGIRQ